MGRITDAVKVFKCAPLKRNQSTDIIQKKRSIVQKQGQTRKKYMKNVNDNITLIDIITGKQTVITIIAQK